MLLEKLRQTAVYEVLDAECYKCIYGTDEKLLIMALGQL